MLIDGQDDLEESDLSPCQRVRQVFIQLSSFIKKNIDPNALFVSWKNDETFSTLSMVDGKEFPKGVDKIATFFDGYRTNTKETNKCFFKFCIHSPGQFDQKLESKLGEWRNNHSFTLYRCTIQAESSRMVGWLEYTLGFTNTNAIKKLLMSKTDYEWGLTLNVVTSTDKKTEWKNSLKAYHVLVPAEKAEEARELISNVFSQQPLNRKYKSLEDTYMFVSSEQRCQGERLSSIYAEMVGRQKFRELHIKIAMIDIIIKDIDTKITTKDEEQVTLREMILNIPVTDTKFGPQKLFHSIDYTPNAGKTWFKNVSGEDGVKGYIVSYMEWDEAEALHVIDGLALHLGSRYSKTGIYEYLMESHWNKVKKWKYNKEDGTWDTPEELAPLQNENHAHLKVQMG